MERFNIKAREPYQILLHFRIYSVKDKPIPYILEDNKLVLAINREEKIYPIEIEINEDQSRIIVFCEKEILDQVKRFLSVDYNINSFYYFIEKLNDSYISELTKKFYGLRPPLLPSVWEGIVKSIFMQQISTRIALKKIGDFVEKYGEKIEINGKRFYSFPSPERISKLTVDELRKIGISRRKAETIISLAREIEKGFDIEDLKNSSFDEYKETLIQFKGIGIWTCKYSYFISVNFESIDLAEDLGVRKEVLKIIGSDKVEDVRKFLEKFERYKGIVSYYLLINHILSQTHGSSSCNSDQLPSSLKEK